MKFDSELQGILDLSGKIALITGGGRGVGQQAAIRLAQAGALIVIADIDEDAGQDTVEKIIESGGQAMAIAVDVSRAADAAHSVERTTERFGGLDILINNAGIFPHKPALDISESDWDQVLDINLKGAFFFAQAAGRTMIHQQRGGRIINIASIAWALPRGNLAHYDSSKGGMVSLTRSLAREFGPHSITVNAIAPGIVSTPGSVGTIRDDAGHMALNANERPIRATLGRHGEADDVARVVYFLASPLSAYVTGSVIEVGGGYHLL